VTTTPQTTSPSEGLPSRTLRAKASAVYGQSSRETSEEQHILDNLPLVRHIVQKVTAQMTHGIDVDELISAGTLGLVKAARGYDPSRDADFRTYAYIRIRGAVIDELRGRSFLPPPTLQQIRAIQHAYRRFASMNGRPPADEELAAEMGMECQELYHTMQEATRQHFMCIHGLTEEPSVLQPLTPLDKGPSPQSQAERRELMERLAAAIMQLPQRDRQVMMLYYERDLTMKEVAAVLKVTESRVCQLHASAVMKLSMLLKEPGDYETERTDAP
jgi:RNA polymerase sigma factor FliA